MGRTEQTIKTIKYSLVSKCVGLILTFVSKTVFLKTLGVEYSGVSGLFTNVLGVLGLSELGIGAAMTFALYKPVAENDPRKTKSLMTFYRKAYNIIAVVVACIGLALLPFLPYLIKGGEDIGFKKLRIYYLIYLFNTVISYFVSYKQSLLYANQKSYICTNIDMVTNIITILVQIVIMITARNFLAYLLVASITGLIRQIYISFYLNKLYPILTERDAEPLEKEELDVIKKNVKAMVFHNIGSQCVGQTDNIIISACIHIVVTGCVSYYTMVMNAANSIINTVLGSSVASIGNLVAKENTEKQKIVIERYVFVNFWLSAFASIGLGTLLTPFVRLVWGDEITISAAAVILLVTANYVQYQLGCLNYIKSAAGIFDQDKYVPLMQSVINLVVSIVLAKKIGIEGVYIGTIAQGVFAWIWKGVVVYKALFDESAAKYFTKQFLYLLTAAVSYGACSAVRRYVIGENVTVLSFAVALALVTLIVNAIFAAVFARSDEFKYLFGFAKSIMRKVLKRPAREK